MFKELGFLVLTLFFSFRASHGLETIHAANFNGNNHTDSLGITYKAVTLKNSERYSETYPNVPKADYSLYQTIAYDRKLNYTIPVNGSGHYLLIVKFVAWNSWSSSFNMLLNGQHSVRSNFTWYDSSGKRDVAYDHYIYFSVCDNTLQYKNEDSFIKNNQIQISISNPVFFTSMSAVAVLKGEIDQVPVVPTAQIYSDADLWQTFNHACYEEPTTSTTEEPTTIVPETTPPESTTSATPPFGDDLKIVHAVNFNGYSHTDSLGISYEPLKYGSSADYSSRIYKKVPYADQPLYRTVYYGQNIKYSVPVNGTGKYLLLIKFLNWDSWSAVFNMTLNGRHMVRSNFTFDKKVNDIAYDHYVYFSMCDNLLQYKKDVSKIPDGLIDVRWWNKEGFITSISALALLKGDVGVVPVLPTAEIYSVSDKDELDDHYCDDVTETTPEWTTTSPWTTTSRPENTTSTTWPPISTSTTSLPPTTPRPPTTPPTTPPPAPPTPPKPAPGQVQVVNIFNTFINSLVKNYNFYYIVNKRNRSVELPNEMSDIEKLDNMIQE